MWFALALTSGLFQVLRNMVMKRIGHSLDETINVWGRFALVLPFAAVTTAWNGIPQVTAEFWWLCLIFAFAQSVATLCLSRALKLSDISLVTPLWKISLVMLVGWGYLTLGESPSLLGVVGIAVSLAGVYLLNARRGRKSLWAPFTTAVMDPGQRYTLISAALYAPCVVLIKQIVLLSDANFGVLISYLFTTAVVTPYTVYRSARQFRRIPQYWKEFLAMGAFASLTILTAVQAYTLTLSSYVEAVKQVEILFALAIGYVVFHEKERVRAIWPGCLAVLAGAVMIRLWG